MPAPQSDVTITAISERNFKDAAMRAAIVVHLILLGITAMPLFKGFGQIGSAYELAYELGQLAGSIGAILVLLTNLNAILRHPSSLAFRISKAVNVLIPCLFLAFWASTLDNRGDWLLLVLVIAIYGAFFGPCFWMTYRTCKVTISTLSPS